MATRKVRESVPATSTRTPTRLVLSAESTCIRKNGIEFRSPTPIPVWTEMTVALLDPADGVELPATGIVVDCRGDRHQGYAVAMVFMELTRFAQDRLSLMAYSNLA